MSVADISVYPRVSMFDMVGLPILPQDFPNTYNYLKHLSHRKSFQASEGTTARMGRLLFKYLPSLVVEIGNWRISKKCMRFDGRQVITRYIFNAHKRWLPGQRSYLTLMGVSLTKFQGI